MSDPKAVVDGLDLRQPFYSHCRHTNRRRRFRTGCEMRFGRRFFPGIFNRNNLFAVPVNWLRNTTCLEGLCLPGFGAYISHVLPADPSSWEQKATTEIPEAGRVISTTFKCASRFAGVRACRKKMHLR